MSEYVKQRVNFMLTPEASDLLDELGEALGLSRSAAVEVAIRKLWRSEIAGLVKLRERGKAR